jgi:hypothetical protein
MAINWDSAVLAAATAGGAIAGGAITRYEKRAKQVAYYLGAGLRPPVLSLVACSAPATMRR